MALFVFSPFLRGGLLSTQLPPNSRAETALEDQVSHLEYAQQPPEPQGEERPFDVKELRDAGLVIHTKGKSWEYYSSAAS